MSWKSMQILSNLISALNVRESPKFSRPLRNRGRGTRWCFWRQILDRKWKYSRFAHAQWKIRNIAFIYGRIAEILASYTKSGSRNTTVTSDFKSEVEIWPFRACAMYPAIIIGTVRSMWTWLWRRYHVPQNVFLVSYNVCYWRLSERKYDGWVFVYGAELADQSQRRRMFVGCLCWRWVE